MIHDVLRPRYPNINYKRVYRIYTAEGLSIRKREKIKRAGVRVPLVAALAVNQTLELKGPEFTCRAFMTWAQKHGIQHILIEPGSPTQNACIESFNGTFGDECPDENWFESLEQARQTIAMWRVDYNETRPHSSCGRVPPATLAALNRQLNELTPRSWTNFKGFHGKVQNRVQA